MEPVRCARPTIKSKSVNQKIWHRSVNCRSFARQAHQLLCLPSHCWAGVKCEVQFSPRLFRCFGFHSVSKSFHPNSCCGWMCSRRLVTLTHTQGDPCVWQPWTLINTSGFAPHQQIHVVRRVCDPGPYYSLKQPFVSSIAEIHYWNLCWLAQ